MRERFLSGDDVDYVDYSKIDKQCKSDSTSLKHYDSDTSLDNDLLEISTIDDEESYFSAD